MVKIYQQAFAHAGTKQVIPDSSDPQGFVSNADGFTSDYELPDTDPNYKPIERAEFNGLMSMVTESLGEIQQFGFAKWQPMQWPQGARVVENDVVYRALTQTSQQPPHADWADESAIGVGQDWQDMTTSRVLGTTYTNTTQRTIFVSITSGLNSSGDSELSFLIGGIVIIRPKSSFSIAGGDRDLPSSLTLPIPPGAEYMCLGGAGTPLSKWMELR